MYFAVAWEEPRMVINESAVEWRDARTGPTDVSNNHQISNSWTANHPTYQPKGELPRKNGLSFGHCPNYPSPSLPPACNFGNVFTFGKATPPQKKRKRKKKGDFSRKCSHIRQPKKLFCQHINQPTNQPTN